MVHGDKKTLPSGDVAGPEMNIPEGPELFGNIGRFSCYFSDQ